MLAAIGGPTMRVCCRPFRVYGAPTPSVLTAAMVHHPCSVWCSSSLRWRKGARMPLSSPLSHASSAGGVQEDEAVRQGSKADHDARQARRLANWKAARAYKESGAIYDGMVEGFNSGGLLIRFYSLLGFLPYPLLSPSHTCTEPQRAIQDIGKGLVGSYLSVKVIQASEEERRLIFSEKVAMWSKYSSQVKVGDIFDGRVGFVEDYGAFIHLRFPDGCYHLTGFAHISEVSWDLVKDVGDFLVEGDDVTVKVIQIDREKSRITLSVKQLEDDPLLEALDKVILQEGQLDPDTVTTSNGANIIPLPGLDSICKELLQEEGYACLIFSFLDVTALPQGLI